MEFIDGAVLQRADDIFTNDSGGGLGGRSMGEIIVVVREVASEGIWRARLSR